MRLSKILGHIQRQDGRVEGLELTFSNENTKITANCWTTTNKIDWKLPKNIPYTHRQKRSHTKRVGGELPWYKQSIAAEWATHRLQSNYTSEAIQQELKFWTSQQIPQPVDLMLGKGAPRAFGNEGQQDLRAEAPQDWRKQRLHAWRVHTGFHVHRVPGQIKDFIRIWVGPTCRS